MTDPRQIEIDTDRVLSHKLVHYGVIDLGSNSIRLVIYDDCGRAPFPRFNEKSFVALGEDLRTHGRFSGAGIDAAVSATALPCDRQSDERAKRGRARDGSDAQG